MLDVSACSLYPKDKMNWGDNGYNMRNETYGNNRLTLEKVSMFDTVLL